MRSGHIMQEGSAMVGFKFITFLLLAVLWFSVAHCIAGDNNRQGRVLRRKQNYVPQFLVPQNQIRARVGDPPLRWSKKLANYAKWWANQRRGDCSLTHSNGPYGENLFWGSGKAWQPKDAVSAWIGEYKFYNYQRNSCNGYQQCGHYTQIVWRKTRSVGCARIICNRGDVFMTCNYDPPGNYIGQKPY
ncbi:hypothetical protein SUGI_0532110 [Cryptomeria japonica]|uniref:pathogenesis-related protein PR-1 n=1 Tax=Cryptomeria japonica TaxID=3369 RepID=UPI002408CE65|nr:pathogenesis-related protein PR-1 [Cryptomeria japonica]GLJ27142.1 hypothetical protein SUGI_0532110 [Cryptomeria japonica]